MEINQQTGLVKNIIYHPSPHCNERPSPQIDLIVIHNISLPPNQWGGNYVDQFFLGKLDPHAHPYFKTISHLRVSPHLFIRRDGQVIQYVPFNRRAWHAGESSFQGRMNCNDFSIGVELEGSDDIPYEKIQYQQLAQLVKALQCAYAIPLSHIVGHSDIAPERKTDPGAAFSWDDFYQCLETV
ncbi:MAG: 1,6-anhydro-N-acetylmuramyl-L-alanine amidase AmpD [Gammaproteobacteria bacterium]|nr:1,6-anhydro-N-acetylmuramyl-L-alanine amidase AmpD [Gammaproteobacteria bacterium]